MKVPGEATQKNSSEKRKKNTEIDSDTIKSGDIRTIEQR